MWKRKQEVLRVSNFALLLVVFIRHHGSGRVNANWPTSVPASLQSFWQLSAADRMMLFTMPAWYAEWCCLRCPHDILNDAICVRNDVCMICWKMLFMIMFYWMILFMMATCDAQIMCWMILFVMPKLYAERCFYDACMIYWMMLFMMMLA